MADLAHSKNLSVWIYSNYWSEDSLCEEFRKVFRSKNKKNNLILLITFNNSLRIGQSHFYFKGQCIQELLFYE